MGKEKEGRRLERLSFYTTIKKEAAAEAAGRLIARTKKCRLYKVQRSCLFTSMAEHWKEEGSSLRELDRVHVDNESMEAFARMLSSVGAVVMIAHLAVEGEKVGQAGWQALAKALEAAQENAVGKLNIEKEAAVIGSRVEVGRCLAKVEEMSIG